MFNKLAYSHFLHHIIPHYLQSLDINNEKLSQYDNADRLLLESKIHNSLQGSATSFLEISAPAMKLVPQAILSSFPYEDSKKKYIIQSHPSLLTDVIPYISDEFLRKKLYLHVTKSFSSNIQEVNYWIKSLRAQAKKKGFKAPIEARNIPLITEELLQSQWDKSSWQKAMVQWDACGKHLKVDGHKAWNTEYCFHLLEKNHSVFSREKVMSHIHDVLRVQYDVECIREENHWNIYQNGVHYGSLECFTGEHITITEFNSKKHCRMGIYQNDELLSLCGVYELWRAYYAMLAIVFKDESILLFNIEHLEDATLNSYSVKDVDETLEDLKNIGSMHYYHRERVHVRDVLTQYYALGSSGKLQDAYKKAFEYTQSEYEDIAYDILGLYESLWDYPYINI